VGAVLIATDGIVIGFDASTGFGPHRRLESDIFADDTTGAATGAGAIGAAVSVLT
jgi:hypothetical protein